ncbi:hypothetical protein [Nocardiopsis sp. NPDC006938]|uniref:hypothetical protein n=1 Tax=Nocardiopsis sp. NPDC006938 TaxID=3364337 RepID=UPI0036BE55C3
MTTQQSVGHPGVDPIVHHPHYRSHTTTPTGQVTEWEFADFDGTEPDPGRLSDHPPVVLDAWMAIFGSGSTEDIRDGMDGFVWTHQMWTQAQRLWETARRRRAITALATLIGPAAREYRRAWEATHTAWGRIEHGPDAGYRGAVLRLRATHADLAAAAHDLDEAAARVVLAARDAVPRTRAGDDRLTPDEIATVLPTSTPWGWWPLGTVEDYHRYPEDTAPRPAAAQAARIAADHLARLADMCAALGLTPDAGIR